MSCNTAIHLRTPLTGSCEPVSAFSSPSSRCIGPYCCWFKSGPGFWLLAWWHPAFGGGCGTEHDGECNTNWVDLGRQPSYHKDTPTGPGVIAAIRSGELSAGGERRLK